MSILKRPLKSACEPSSLPPNRSIHPSRVIGLASFAIFNSKVNVNPQFSRLQGIKATIDAPAKMSAPTITLPSTSATPTAKAPLSQEAANQAVPLSAMATSKRCPVPAIRKGLYDKSNSNGPMAIPAKIAMLMGIGGGKEMIWFSKASLPEATLQDWTILSRYDPLTPAPQMQNDLRKV